MGKEVTALQHGDLLQCRSGACKSTDAQMCSPRISGGRRPPRRRSGTRIFFPLQERLPQRSSRLQGKRAFPEDLPRTAYVYICTRPFTNAFVLSPV